MSGTAISPPFSTARPTSSEISTEEDSSKPTQPPPVISHSTTESHRPSDGNTETKLTSSHAATQTSSSVLETSILSSLGSSHPYSFPTVPTAPYPSSSTITGPHPSDAGAGGLNKAIIAGVVVGGVAFVAVVVFGIWFWRKVKKQQDDDDISMVGMPRTEDVPMGMRNGIRLVRGNTDRI
ncbi:hypothetical protein J7T55_005308 [Diaporthe amygdali]|uniref:uncharacterized protein n=1 Tax=Phomopsis amygdali TaxID=1214568 RepID=UPI0022FE45CC|nr:uncharacterized protein J7T55_005308 [Diaporthe amygdali]KAJ0108331.1 hypothetical protein J7T55_005308 [Diaporthe amygdali]